MKTIAMLGTVLFIVFSSSCKKQSHCIIKDSSGSIIKDYGNKTGTSTDVNNYENSCKADAAQYNASMSCNN